MVIWVAKTLSTDDTPLGSAPSVKDFTYYSHKEVWLYFNRNFGYANGLIMLGKIDSGIEKLEWIRSDKKKQLTSDIWNNFIKI